MENFRLLIPIWICFALLLGSNGASADAGVVRGDKPAGGVPNSPADAPVPVLEDPTPDVGPRNRFLQDHFTNFQAIGFVMATNGESILQRLKVNTHMVPFNGHRFTGFRFTVPDWIDGNFEWMYIHLTNEANKNRIVRASWFIVPEHGKIDRGFEDYRFKAIGSLPNLKKRFPNSRQVIYQTLDRARLKPGESYVIWFRYEGPAAVPDIAVALSIHSTRGHQEFGTLPLD